jgi:hypothetical protein
MGAWMRSKRNLVRTVAPTDSVMVTFPLPRVEEEAIRKTFMFASNQMATALSNLMETRNLARQTRQIKHEATLKRFIDTVAKVSRDVDDQRNIWNAALKSKQPRTIRLPNYPVTPTMGYAKSNTLRYQKNKTMLVLSPKVRVIMDTIGQRFGIMKTELRMNTTQNFKRSVNSAKTVNALKRLESVAWKNGVNANTIRSVITKRTAQLFRAPWTMMSR